MYSEFLRKRYNLPGEAVKMRAVDNNVDVDLYPEKVGIDRLPQDQKRTLALHPTSHGLSEVSLPLLQKWSRSRRVRFAEHSLYDLYLLFAFARLVLAVCLRGKAPSRWPSEGVGDDHLPCSTLCQCTLSTE